MRTRYLSTLVILIVFVISGCEKVIDFDQKDITPQLVVNCILDPDHTIKIKVTKSKSAIDETVGFEAIKDATISLSDGTTTFSDFVFVEDQDTLPYYNWGTNSEFHYILFENGYYINPSIKIANNKSYSIKVSAPGFDEVISETEVLSLVPIEKMDTFVTQSAQQSSILYTLNAKVNFTDPKDENNFYMLEMEKVFLDMNEDYNTHEYKPSFSYWKFDISSDDPVFEKDNPGFFSTGSSSLYPVFNDALIDGSNYSISFGIEGITTDTEFTGFPADVSWGDIKNYRLVICKINLYSISESYYQYIKTKTLQDNAEGDPFSDPVLVYTNVENGMGIFGSKSISSAYLKLSNVPDSLLSKEFLQLDNEGAFNFIKQEDAKQSTGGYYFY